MKVPEFHTSVFLTGAFAGVCAGLLTGALIMFARKEHLQKELDACEESLHSRAVSHDRSTGTYVGGSKDWELNVVGGHVSLRVNYPSDAAVCSCDTGALSVACSATISRASAARVAAALTTFANERDE